jgi:D-proline reductase (dithiol) PrdA
MSITKEHAAQLQDKPAVVCCRTVKGTKLAPADLEDPAIFADLQESGLISITPDTLTIGEVLGAVLNRDVDGLTSLTADMLEGVQLRAKAEPLSPIAPAPSAPEEASGVARPAKSSGGVFHLKVKQATDLELSFPLSFPQGAPLGEYEGGFSPQPVQPSPPS